MDGYLLPHHVHLCILDDAAIFLDSRKNEYFGVNETRMRMLPALVRGLPNPDPELVPAPEAVAFGEKLIEKGLLTHDESLGGNFCSPILEFPNFGVPDTYELVPPKFHVGHTMSAVCAYRSAAVALRRRSLDYVLNRLRCNKPSADEAGNPDPEPALVLTRVFLHLQPLIYTAADHCLEESLALVNFLSRHRVFPTFVVGVRTTPFGAHCWVQHGQWVLSDSAGAVREFTPILAV